MRDELFNPRELLALSVPAIQKILCTKVTKTDFINKGFLIFGAGQHCKIIVPHLLDAGLSPDWIVDGNPDLVGTTICNIPVRGKDSLNCAAKRYILLGSRHVSSMLNDCEAYGALHPLLMPSIADFCFLPASLGLSIDTLENNANMLKAYSLLNDIPSRRIFKKFITFHCQFTEELFEEYDKDIYFPADLTQLIDYTRFVDAGAFNGDTFSDWLYRFDSFDGQSHRYWAFEPGKEQFSHLQTLINILPESVQSIVSAYPMALGNTTARLYLGGNGASATLSGKKTTSVDVTSAVEVVRLDDIPDINPTFLKADVEGFEIPLLEGAQSVIQQYHPALAISVYHSPSDIWEIPLWINQCVPSYKLYLRHHSPFYGDTVCYAIPSHL